MSTTAPPAGRLAELAPEPSAEDLAAAKLRENRAHWAELVAVGQAAEVELPTIDAQLAKLQSEFETSQRRHSNAVEQLARRRAELTEAMTAAVTPRIRMRQTGRQAHPGIGRQLAALDTRRKAASDRKHNAKERLDHLQRCVSEELRLAEGFEKEHPFHKDHLDNAESAKRQSKAMEQTIAAIQGEIDGMNEEGKILMAAIMEP